MQVEITWKDATAKEASENVKDSCSSASGKKYLNVETAKFSVVKKYSIEQQ